MRYIRSMRQAQVREDSVLFYPDNWGSAQARVIVPLPNCEVV